MARKPEDKHAIVEWFDGQHGFWQEVQAGARRPWTRLFARGMARWSAGGSSDYRERIAGERKDSSAHDA